MLLQWYNVGNGIITWNIVLKEKVTWSIIQCSLRNWDNLWYRYIKLPNMKWCIWKYS